MKKEYIHCNGFKPEFNVNSKILILGTLPPCTRDWYYKKDWMFWRIIQKAINTNIDLFHCSLDIKKQILSKNKIALWDIIHKADRIEGSRKDVNIINIEPNNIMEELNNNKINISAIIINGYNQNIRKTSAFKWFKEYNNLVGNPNVNNDISKNSIYYLWNDIKVYPLQATSAINQNKKRSLIDYEELWVKTLKKYI